MISPKKKTYFHFRFQNFLNNLVILAFHKPGKDKLFPQNYRPISLLPKLSKIFEKIILNRIKIHGKENNTVMQEQFGFREGRSTVHQLARLTNDITTEFNKNRSTALVLLDIEKAFDTVWHKGLIHKLHVSNLPLYTIKIIQNYLKKRTLAVSVNDTHSNTQKIAAGVPQGSILGPVLFLYYINDIPQNTKVKIALFADDTALYSSSWRNEVAIKNLQIYINSLMKYYNKWKIKINEAKTEQVMFSLKKNRKPIPGITINGTTTIASPSAKYLGMHLDKKLLYWKHINETRIKIGKLTGLLYCLINRKSTLTTQNKLTIYKTLIKPVLLYAAPVWSSAANTYIQKHKQHKTNYLELSRTQTEA